MIELTPRKVSVKGNDITLTFSSEHIKEIVYLSAVHKDMKLTLCVNIPPVEPNPEDHPVMKALDVSFDGRKEQ